MKIMRGFPCLLLLAAPLVQAAPKPGFNGVWTINMTRSEFGAQMAPKKLALKIEHKDPILKLQQSETSPLDQEVKFECTYSTTGKEASNNVLGSTVKSVTVWDGEEIVIHSWSEIAGRKVEFKERWRLTENGTTLIVDRQGSGLGGLVKQTLVFDKK